MRMILKSLHMENFKKVLGREMERIGNGEQTNVDR